MLSPSDPSLLAMLLAPPEVLADWLTDQGALLPDVLRLFAGTPPAHADGISQETLAAWLRANDDERHLDVAVARMPEPGMGLWRSSMPLGIDDGTRFAGYVRSRQSPGMIVLCGCAPPGTRLPATAREVMACPPIGSIIIQQSNIHTRDNRIVWQGTCHRCRCLSWMLDDDAPERRLLKRQCLSSFGDVLVPTEAGEKSGCDLVPARFSLQILARSSGGVIRVDGEGLDVGEMVRFDDVWRVSRAPARDSAQAVVLRRLGDGQIHVHLLPST